MNPNFNRLAATLAATGAVAGAPAAAAEVDPSAHRLATTTNGPAVKNAPEATTPAGFTPEKAEQMANYCVSIVVNARPAGVTEGGLSPKARIFSYGKLAELTLRDVPAARASAIDSDCGRPEFEAVRKKSETWFTTTKGSAISKQSIVDTPSKEEETKSYTPETQKVNLTGSRGTNRTVHAQHEVTVEQNGKTITKELTFQFGNKLKQVTKKK